MQLCKKHDNKIIDDNDNDKIIDDSDNDFYCISIIIKLKNIVVIKDINSILKINKLINILLNKLSQAYLGGCNFIDDSDNKRD